MSHFLGRVVKLIKEHKSTSDNEKKQLDRFEEHVQLFIKMETILTQPDPTGHIQGDEEADKIDEKNIAELDREKKERIERDNANIQRVDAQTKKYF